MSYFGIDVSENNGKLDWAKLKAAGVQYAIIRGGYGRYAVDGEFCNNIRGALAQGIPVGVYWFSYATNTAAAKQEAQKCLDTIRGYEIKLPIFFDFEYDTVDYAKKQGVTLGRQAFNDHTVAFCETIKTAGYTPGVYYNLDYYNRFVDKSRIGGYVQWYAQYNKTADVSGWDIWQYSSTAKLGGHSCYFDVNTLENASLLSGKTAVEPGWKKNASGWWYVYEDGSYPTAQWALINNKWYYFGEEGYMMENKWVVDDGNLYYLGEDGAMVTNRAIKIGSDGKATPAGAYYDKLGDVPDMYRPTLDKLIQEGKLKGRDGTGLDLVLDMSEEMVRALVIMDRGIVS